MPPRVKNQTLVRRTCHSEQVWIWGVGCRYVGGVLVH